MIPLITLVQGLHLFTIMKYTLTNVFSPYLFKHKRHLLKVQLMNILQIKQISSKYICVLIFHRSAVLLLKLQFNLYSGI